MHRHNPFVTLLRLSTTARFYQMALQAHAFLFSMVETGEFSDFTLVCDGHEFKLHRVVVCPQSLVIAAALSGGFQVCIKT